MEKFKEKKIVDNLFAISSILGVIWFLSLILIIFNEKFVIGLFLLPISAILIMVAGSLSDKEKYTKQFIIYISERLKSAKTLEELLDIEDSFMYLAVKNKQYCLSFPNILKYIHQEIINKIDILQKYENNRQI